jgi:hypothetical protein
MRAIGSFGLQMLFGLIGEHGNDLCICECFYLLDQTLFWASASVGINGNLNDLHHSVQSDAEFALWPQALRRRLRDGPILHPFGPPYDRVSDYRAGSHNEATKAVAEAARTSLRSNMTVLI